ncbi:MAG: hypothetical protein ACREFY_12390 [Acetobacteraceae bacterium]
MALPLLGLAVRLKGNAAHTHECEITATFVDGTLVGPLAAGQVAQTETLAPLEAVLIDLRPRTGRPGRAAAAAPSGFAPSPAARFVSASASAPLASAPSVPASRTPASPVPASRAAAAPASPAKRKMARRPR